MTTKYEQSKSLYEPSKDFRQRYMNALRNGRVLLWLSEEALRAEIDRKDLLWLSGALAYIVDSHWCSTWQSLPDV